MAGTYLISTNFKVFDEPERAFRTMAVGTVFTIILFVGIFTIPGSDKLPNYLLPVIYTWIAYYLAQRYQASSISGHLGSGGIAFGWGRTIAISLGFGAVTVAIVLGAVIAYTFATADPVSKSYGQMQHEITFDRSNISEAEVDRIAAAFTEANFFDQESQKAIDVKKHEDIYEIAISCNDSIKNDPEAVRQLGVLRKDIQKMFPDNPIVFDLAIGTPDNIVKRIE